VAFDPSLGGEVRKTRPAVVVSNDLANSVLNRLVVVPISSQIAKVYPAETLVVVSQKKQKAMADQITTISKLRLRDRMGTLSAQDLAAVEGAVLLHLAIK
jgi:mRNA interferase MazF